MNPNQLPDPAEFRQRTPLQIRFNDVDVLGHVNNTVYLSFYDTGKAYYFNAVREGSMDWGKVDTVIANVNCAYIAPIVFGEEVEVRTRCVAIKDKSFVLQQIILESRTGQIKSVCETVMVSYDPEAQVSKPLAEAWRRRLTEFEGRELQK